MRSPRGAPLVLGLTAIALVACSSHPSAVDRTVQRYLLCEECREGELDSVLALRGSGEEALITALNRGPSEDRVKNMRLQAEAMYDRIPSPQLSRQQYVDHYDSNYHALYVKRAALGLRRFTTPSAHAALIEAVRRDTLYREDVRQVLGAAAGVVPLVVTGDGQQGAVDSLVKANPTVQVVDYTTGQGIRSVRVVFVADSGGGTVLDTVRYTDAAGMATTRWRLGPTESVNTLKAVAAGQVVRIRAFAHDTGASVVFLVQPTNGRRGQPITPAIRFAVQDAWGALQTNFTLSARVTVVPMGVTSSRRVTGGVGDLTGFSVPDIGTGLRLQVVVPGTQPVFSQAFDIAP